MLKYDPETTAEPTTPDEEPMMELADPKPIFPGYNLQASHFPGLFA